MEQIDFNFLNDSKIKDIVERDYKELQDLASNNTTKSIIIVSGGILESLLIDALVFAKELDFNTACQKRLVDLINLAKSKKIIREDVLSNAIRNYRNLVHAGKEIRENMHFDSADADLALSAIKIVLRDIKNWYEKERFLWTLEDNILQLTEEQKDFLKLFASPSPTAPNQPEHPLIKHRVYSSIRKLVENKILREEKDERSKKVTYHLTPDAINFIEKHIIHGKPQRTSIKIDDKNIEPMRWIKQ
jgi:hypothetical protein